MEKPTIIEALERFFSQAFPDLSSWTNWLILLKAIYALPLTAEEAEIFTTYTGRSPRPEGFRELYVIAGRRAGKSRIAALVACYEALFGNWEAHLAKGEQARIFIIATDKSQAQIVLCYIKALLEPYADMVERELAEEIHLRNRVVLAVKTASFRAGRGFSTAVIIGDEIGFWRDEESSNPAAEIIASLLPGLLPNGLLIGASTPYSKWGYLYDQFKQNYGQAESDVLIWKAPTLVMNPLYDPTIIERLIKRDRAVYTAEYNAEFREDVEAFIPEALLDAAMVRPSPTPRAEGVRYHCFIDPSGGASDSFTLAIAHQDEAGKIVLDCMDEVRPPFDPASVVEAYCKMMTGYGIREVTSDRYAGVWVESAFQARGVKVRRPDLTASEIYLEVQPLFSMGRLELIKHDRLRVQFLQLERTTQTGGRDRVTHGTGQHDDLANAVAGACVEASRRRTLTPKEMELRLPIVQRHDDDDTVDLMDEFMKESGGSRIIKRSEG